MDEGIPIGAEGIKTHADGQRLIDLIKQAQPSVVLGPNGQPLDGPKIVNNGDGKPTIQLHQASVDPEVQQKAQRQAFEDRMKLEAEKKAREISEVSELLKTVSGEAPITARCMEMMLYAHRLIMYAKLEMELADERIGSKALFYAESIMQRKAYNEGGFPVKRLVTDLKQQVVPFIESRRFDAEESARKRQSKLKPVLKNMGKRGIALPASLNKANGGAYMAGTFVLHGKTSAEVHLALDICRRLHLKTDGGKSVWLTNKVENIEVAPKGIATMLPPAWWHNAARSLYHFYAVMEPVLDGPALLVCVEDMNDLLHTQAEPKLKHGQIITHTQQWAVENFVAVLLGHVTDAEIAADDTSVYGGLPHCPVRLEEKEGKKYLLIGTDPYSLEDLCES